MKRGRIELEESVNLQELEQLLYNVDTEIVQEERQKFKSYACDMFATGQRTVTYLRAKKQDIGRVYADGALSLQGFSKGIRSKLAKGIYHDIDIKNCHPVLLLQIIERNPEIVFIPKKLRYYVENRDMVLAQIQDTAKCTRGKAKILMLSLLYGGKLQTWKSKNNNPKVPSFVTQYAFELLAIADLLYPKTSHNQKFSNLSLMIQNVEHEILMCISNSLETQGYLPGVYMFDGLMVYRLQRDSVDPIDCDILRKVEADVLKETGYTIELEEKEI